MANSRITFVNLEKDDVPRDNCSVRKDPILYTFYPLYNLASHSDQSPDLQ